MKGFAKRPATSRKIMAISPETRAAAQVWAGGLLATRTPAVRADKQFQAY